MGPYLVEPVDRVRVWTDRSLDVFRKLATEPNTGVRLVSGIEASRTPVEPPDWGNRLDGFRMCHADELPAGFVTGWRYTVPTIDMPVYLGYLQGRLAEAGGSIEIRRVDDLTEAARAAPVVVNCTGIGARALVPDPDLIPTRGQLVVIENPGITEFFSEDTGLSPALLHYSPHGQAMILGGTAEANTWSREPDLVVDGQILARCAEVEPRLRGARVIEHRVGLRPTRPYVRVEDSTLDGVRIIHNYGHGGAGVTRCPGAAPSRQRTWLIANSAKIERRQVSSWSSSRPQRAATFEVTRSCAIGLCRRG